MRSALVDSSVNEGYARRVPGLVAARMSSDERARLAQVLRPARAGAGPGGVRVVHRGVEAQAGHHHVGVAAVGVHGDPAPGTRLTPAHEGAARERRAQEAPAVERVGDGAGAVVAAVEPAGAEQLVPAAVAVGLL